MNIVCLNGKIHEIRPQERVTYVTLHCRQGKQSEFIDVTIFQNEFFNQYFTTGMWMSVQGHLHKNTYNGKRTVEIIADSISFSGNKAPSVTDGFTELTDEERETLPF